MHHTKRAFLPILASAIAITTFLRASAPQTPIAQARTTTPVTQSDTRTFPETGQTIGSDFLKYWNEHGALAQQGFPISPEMQELSEIDGKSYTVQYFERAKFEKHPEQSDPANQVLLELFGVLEYRDRYPQSTYPQGAPNQTADTTPGSVLFDLTGKRLGGTFLQYWKTHGDVRQQGYPISDVFEEVAEDGKTYRVQYFERAKFELHTEFAGTVNEVLLSRIGAKFVEKRYVKGGDGSFTPKPNSTSTPIVATPTPTETPKPTEGILTLEVPYDYGTLKFYAQQDAVRFDYKNKADIGRLFSEIYRLRGYSGNFDIIIAALPKGVLDGLTTYSNGTTVYDESKSTSLGREFHWKDTDMEEKSINGVKTGIIYYSTRNNPPGDSELLVEAQGNEAADHIAAGIEKSLLSRLCHFTKPEDFGTLIANRKDLSPLWGSDGHGNWDGGAQVPLKVLPPSP